MALGVGQVAETAIAGKKRELASWRARNLRIHVWAPWRDSAAAPPRSAASSRWLWLRVAMM